MRIIGYGRVSTVRQGASGLGIAAQRQAIDGFVHQRSATLIARFTEVESGRNPDRPELGKALHLAKVTGATLVIAKLDRLSRNAAFLLTLRDSGAKFAAVDLPEANDLTVGIAGRVRRKPAEWDLGSVCGPTQRLERSRGAAPRAALRPGRLEQAAQGAVVPGTYRATAGRRGRRPSGPGLPASGVSGASTGAGSGSGASRRAASWA